MVIVTSAGDTGLEEDMMIEKTELNEINKEVKAEEKNCKVQKDNTCNF